MTNPELVTAAEVAALLRDRTGAEWATSSARAWLSRHHIPRADVTDDPQPKALYDRAKIEDELDKRAGRGRRTDLHGRKDQQ